MDLIHRRGEGEKSQNGRCDPELCQQTSSRVSQTTGQGTCVLGRGNI